MQTNLAPQFKGTPDGDEAEAILRKCVHCGFCTATCPTYQVLGDELDGPRGRIYLIKQALEGQPVTASTQLHLDRCLTCRNCESTCPSGVQYGRLVEIGRAVVDAQVERTPRDKATRWLLKEGLTSPLFKPAVRLGQAVKGLLPPTLADKLPAKAPPQAHDWPTRTHARKVLLLTGCVQPALMPNINSATARVLDAAGIQTLVADHAGCCGAMRTHLGDREGGLADMRRNIDAWWAVLQTQPSVEAIVMNASGCGTMVKDYAHAFRRDPAYAEKAQRITELTRDLSELLPEVAAKLKTRLRKLRDKKLAYHAPCTLQHGQQVRGLVETHLAELGFEVSVPQLESHLCCGSAGTYSVLQPEMAKTLRTRKLSQLEPLQPQAIVSANIGCIQHLQAGTSTPVKHWVEVLDEALSRL
jgi:glycolate oxidase iron-sulfur subunit